MPSRNEMIEVNGERRSLRRDQLGRCRLSDDLGESVSGHPRQHFVPTGKGHSDAIAYAHGIHTSRVTSPLLRGSRVGPPQLNRARIEGHAMPIEKRAEAGRLPRGDLAKRRRTSKRLRPQL